jgi:hypothetical protein
MNLRRGVLLIREKTQGLKKYLFSELKKIKIEFRK